jgi:hypothetical protein
MRDASSGPQYTGDQVLNDLVVHACIPFDRWKLLVAYCGTGPACVLLSSAAAHLGAAASLAVSVIVWSISQRFKTRSRCVTLAASQSTTRAGMP